jgi:hypothetical protein
MFQDREHRSARVSLYIQQTWQIKFQAVLEASGVVGLKSTYLSLCKLEVCEVEIVISRPETFKDIITQVPAFTWIFQSEET